jgi:hypothetical protein
MLKKVQTAVYIKLCAIAIYLVIGNVTYFFTTCFLRNQGEKSDPAPGRYCHARSDKYGAAAGSVTVWVRA